MVPSTVNKSSSTNCRNEDILDRCELMKGETWNLMDGAEHKETWYLVNGAEQMKTWYLMDGAKHIRRLGT